MAVGAGKGGIGGSGVGWGGSGNQSRSDAAHAGANVGRSSVGGRGGDGGRSGRGTSSNSRGPDSVAGIGRRQSAISSFTSGIKSGFKGLTNTLSGWGQDIGKQLGYGYDPAPTFTGSTDLGKLEAHTQSQIEKGEKLARRDQAINTAASVVGANPITGIGSSLM